MFVIEAMAVEEMETRRVTTGFRPRSVGSNARTACLSLLLLVSAITTPSFVYAQPSGSPFRIGYLSPGSTDSHGPFFKVFREALREYGYVEGKNVVFEYRWAAGTHDKLGLFAAELVRLKPAVLMTSTTPAALALKEAAGQTPVILLGVGDPVGVGLVASLARPGGNITGFSLNVPEIAGKRVELLREAVPGLVRVAIVGNPANESVALVAREADAAARMLGFQSHFIKVRGPAEFKTAFDSAVERRVGGVIVVEDPLTVAHRKTITALAAERRLPGVFGLKLFVEAGGLMSYAPSYPDLYRRAAVFVDKILRGASPADLPVEQPTKYELILNLKTAEALGITLPSSLVLRADQVIQ
jgi:putative ABC transport system substrate-binding protein